MIAKHSSAAQRKKVRVMSTRAIRAARSHSKLNVSAIAASQPERIRPVVAPKR